MKCIILICLWLKYLVRVFWLYCIKIFGFSGLYNNKINVKSLNWQFISANSNRFTRDNMVFFFGSVVYLIKWLWIRFLVWISLLIKEFEFGGIKYQVSYFWNWRIRNNKRRLMNSVSYDRLSKKFLNDYKYWIVRFVLSSYEFWLLKLISFQKRCLNVFFNGLRFLGLEKVLGEKYFNDIWINECLHTYFFFITNSTLGFSLFFVLLYWWCVIGFKLFFVGLIIFFQFIFFFKLPFVNFDHNELKFIEVFFFDLGTDHYCNVSVIITYLFIYLFCVSCLSLRLMLQSWKSRNDDIPDIVRKNREFRRQYSHSYYNFILIVMILYVLLTELIIGGFFVVRSLYLFTYSFIYLFVLLFVNLVLGAFNFVFSLFLDLFGFFFFIFCCLLKIVEFMHFFFLNSIVYISWLVNIRLSFYFFEIIRLIFVSFLFDRVIFVLRNFFFCFYYPYIGFARLVFYFLDLILDFFVFDIYYDFVRIKFFLVYVYVFLFKKLPYGIRVLIHSLICFIRRPVILIIGFLILPIFYPFWELFGWYWFSLLNYILLNSFFLDDEQARVFLDLPFDVIFDMYSVVLFYFLFGLPWLVFFLFSRDPKARSDYGFVIPVFVVCFVQSYAFLILGLSEWIDDSLLNYSVGWSLDEDIFYKFVEKEVHDLDTLTNIKELRDLENKYLQLLDSMWGYKVSSSDEFAVNELKYYNELLDKFMDEG